jgi:hypothetical protein
MDVDYLKSEFLNVKSFLYKLYTENPRQNAATLNQSIDQKLDVLIKILHLICTGVIHLRKVDHEVIKKSKRLNFLKSNFNTKLSYIRLLKSPREQKLIVLRKFCGIYQALLFTMFNLI